MLTIEKGRKGNQEKKPQTSRSLMIDVVEDHFLTASESAGCEPSNSGRWSSSLVMGAAWGSIEWEHFVKVGIPFS